MTTEQRLERLERENRWMRRIGAVGVAVAAAVFLIGQGKEKEPQDLEVRSLKVVDKDGNVRITLGTRPLGPYLHVKDGQGKDRIEFGTVEYRTKSGTLKATPFFGLGDGRGFRRMMLSVLPDGMPKLELYDKDANGLAALELIADKATGAKGTLTFLDATGKLIWQAPED